MESGGVYEIKNIDTGKVYIGSTKDFEKRFNAHRNDLNRQAHHSRYLQSAWNKYGEGAFTFRIIERVKNNEDLLNREQHWIDATGAYGDGYNMCPTAGNCMGRKFSDATRKKMSESAKARPPISEETRRKLSEIQKSVPASVRKRIADRHRGQKRSAETRRKMSLAQRGKIPSNATRAKLAEIARNMPQEQRDKIAASLRGRKGKPHSQDAKRKMSEAKREWWRRKKELEATTNG